MANVLIPVPDHDFDPTETGVPWRTLCRRNHRVVFATPNGKIASADPRMVTGKGLGILAPLMKADRNGQSAYEQMRESQEFRHPIAYGDLDPKNFDGIILPGGHAQGMREYLESSLLQSIVAEFFAHNLPRTARRQRSTPRALTRLPRGAAKIVQKLRLRHAESKTEDSYQGCHRGVFRRDH